MSPQHRKISFYSPTVLVLGACLAAIGLAGCAEERPLHVVREDAQWAMEHGKYNVAIADYNEFLKRKPGEVDVRYELGKAYLAAGECKSAMEQLTTCVDVRPDNDEYAAALAASYFACNETDRLTLFLRRITSERGTPADYILLGTYAQKMGHPDEAIQALKTAAKIDEGRSLAPQLALADFYGSVGDRTNQARRLRMALSVSPGNQKIMDQLRALGEVIGPTLPIKPDEAP